MHSSHVSLIYEAKHFAQYINKCTHIHCVLSVFQQAIHILVRCSLWKWVVFSCVWWVAVSTSGKMLTTLAVGVVSIILVFILWLLEMKRRYRSIAHIPGPKRTFFIGNALDMGQNPVGKYIHCLLFITIAF